MLVAKSLTWPLSFTASAALARPGPIAAATSAPVTGLGNWRWLPSGSVIVGMIASCAKGCKRPRKPAAAGGPAAPLGKEGRGGKGRGRNHISVRPPLFLSPRPTAARAGAHAASGARRRFTIGPGSRRYAAARDDRFLLCQRPLVGHEIQRQAARGDDGKVALAPGLVAQGD